MYKTLRIIFTVLSAVCVLPVVFLGVYVGLPWAILCALAAAAFFGLAALFKKLQEAEEERKNPPPPAGDFFSPLPKPPETGEPDNAGSSNRPERSRTDEASNAKAEKPSETGKPDRR